MIEQEKECCQHTALTETCGLCKEARDLVEQLRQATFSAVDFISVDIPEVKCEGCGGTGLELTWAGEDFWKAISPRVQEMVDAALAEREHPPIGLDVK